MTPTSPRTLRPSPFRCRPRPPPVARWSLIGVPLLLMMDERADGDEAEQTATGRPSADFHPEDAHGVLVTDPQVVAQVLASSTSRDPLSQRIKPWSWDGTRYVRADVVESGCA